jgi:hypothetical protein
VRGSLSCVLCPVLLCVLRLVCAFCFLLCVWCRVWAARRRRAMTTWWARPSAITGEPCPTTCTLRPSNRGLLSFFEQNSPSPSPLFPLPFSSPASSLPFALCSAFKHLAPKEEGGREEWMTMGPGKAMGSLAALQPSMQGRQFQQYVHLSYNTNLPFS